MKKAESIERSAGSPPTVRDVGGKPTLSDDESARVVEVMRLLKRDRYDDNGAALGRALGVSQPNISGTLSGRHRPSFATAKKVAALYGVEVSDLLGQGGSARPRTVNPETHPNLYAALRMTRDRSPGVARDNVMAAASNLPDLAFGTWVSMITDDAHARAERQAQAPRRAPATMPSALPSMTPLPETAERLRQKKPR